MNQIFLSFYADGPHWDNIIKIPAYPSGISYYRPFRYRDTWIQQQILREIENMESIASFIGKEVILCMRFLEENYKYHILPVRKAEIIKIDYFPDNHSVYFKMGAFFDLSQYDSLISACLLVPSSEYNSVSNHLLFQSSVTCPDTFFPQSLHEEKAWVIFSDRIASDTSVPINNEARKSLFLRFELPESEHKVPISIIHESKNRGSIYGPVLSEGKTYEFVISHRIPSLISKNTTSQPIKMEISNSTSNFEISPSSEEITGNYQNHIITLFPKKPSGAWEEIVISPQVEAKAQDGSIINTRSLNLPLKIKLSVTHRLKTQYFWLILVWVALFFSIFFDKLLSIEGNETNYQLIIGIGISTLLTSFAIFILQQHGISIK